MKVFFDTDDSRMPAFDIVIEKGRRTMRWTLAMREYDPADLADTLTDILEQMDLPLKDQDVAFREYQAGIQQEIAGGAKVIDPRVAGQMQSQHAQEADVANSPTHGAYVQAAINGARMMKDGDDPMWAKAATSLVDFDDDGAKERAARQAASKGVGGEGPAKPGVNYGGRWAGKESDHYR